MGEDNRPNVYLDEELGAWIYRASASGECVRALVAMALEYDSERTAEMSDLLTRTAREGDLHEDDMRNQLIAEGHILAGEQEEIMVPVVKGQVYLRGHIDDRILEGPRLREGRPAVWEAKSLSTGQWKTWMAKSGKKGGELARFASNSRKAAQATVYMTAFPDHDMLYQSKRRDDGTVDTVLLTEPPIPFKTIRNKILIAESYRRKGMLPACDIDGRWGCDFFYLHEETVLPDDPVDEEIMEALGAACLMYDQYREAEKAGKAAEEARKKEVNPELLRLLGDHPFVETGDFKVSRVGPYDMTSTDWKAVEAEADEEMRELIARHTRTYSVEYPKVTRQGGGR